MTRRRINLNAILFRKMAKVKGIPGVTLHMVLDARKPVYRVCSLISAFGIRFGKVSYLKLP